ASMAALEPLPVLANLDVAALCKAVGDPLRANILRVLARDSYGVLELASMFDKAQPAISHHLKLLKVSGLVTSRREGQHLYYQRTHIDAHGFVQALFAALDDEPLPTRITQRIKSINNVRTVRSRAFFAEHASDLAQLHTRICAPDIYVDEILHFARLKRDQTALEVGPGDGTILASLLPQMAAVTTVDESSAVLANLDKRFANTHALTTVHADFLGWSSRSRYDLVNAAMVLHHLASPAAFFAAAARRLRPDGLLVVTELKAHQHEWVRELGDVWLGFESSQLETWARDAGLRAISEKRLAQRNGLDIIVNCYQTNTGI
ncbi:MAG: metalloregulator ArsR/SmtB family transcription factor, partial [Pseudomonadota bacterium]